MTAPHRVTSPMVHALETAWNAIRRYHPEIPAVAFTLGAGSIGAKPGTLTLGHFAVGRWTVTEANDTHEIFIAGELLAMGAEKLLGTLLHEATHALAHVRQVQDTSRNGRYHNRRFAELAAEMGLEAEQVGAIGWSGTSITELTARRYLREINRLAAAIKATRRAELSAAGGSAGTGGAGGRLGTGRKSNNNGLVLVCECEEPRRIRVAVSVADLGPIVCAVCRSEFLAAA